MKTRKSGCYLSKDVHEIISLVGQNRNNTLLLLNILSLCVSYNKKLNKECHIQERQSNAYFS